MDRKKSNVPLEEALILAGTGFYTYLVVVISGIVDFAAFCGIQLMSVVIPAASCDLKLTTYQKGALTSMVYTGMMCSTHMTGFLADKYGRRRVMLICCIGTTVMCLVSGLAHNATFLMVYSYIAGLFIAGIYTPIYVFVGEFCPEKIRTRGLFICCAISSLSTVYLPGIAWLIIPMKFRFDLFGTGLVFTSWRLFVVLLALLFVGSSLLLYFIPETPKFLLSVDRHKETMDVLKHIYSINKRKDKEDFPVSSVCLDSSDRVDETDNTQLVGCSGFVKTLVRQTLTLFNMTFLRCTIISCLINIGVMGIFNTILLWFPENVTRLVQYKNTHETQNATLCEVMSTQLPFKDPSEQCNLKGDVFIINIVYGIFQGLFYVLFSFIAPYFRRNHLLIFFSALPTVACAVVLFTDIVLLTIFCLGSILLLLMIMFPVYIRVVLEFFPTSLRSTASSVIMLTGRIMTVLFTQLMGAMYENHCAEAYTGLTAMLAGMTVLCFFVPTHRKV